MNQDILSRGKKIHLNGQRRENNNVPKSEVHLEDCFYTDKGNCVLTFLNELL